MVIKAIKCVCAGGRLKINITNFVKLFKLFIIMRVYRDIFVMWRAPTIYFKCFTL